jgi:hypothetical protein
VVLRGLRESICVCSEFMENRAMQPKTVKLSMLLRQSSRSVAPPF